MTEEETRHYYTDLAERDADATVIAIRDQFGLTRGSVSFKVRKREVRIHYIGSKRRGTGAKLMNMVIQAADGRPITLLSENDSIGFYQKMGFRITKRGDAVSHMRRD